MITICPGCGVALESTTCIALMDEVNAWTLELHDPEFIHQLLVCTYGASHWKPGMKPITLAFALIGLYLACERGYDGKQIQSMHTKLANASKTWPVFPVPDTKATLSIKDVIEVEPEKRAGMVYEWAQSVWGVWRDQSDDIAHLLDVL